LEKIIDLRSDTVTKPSHAMREAMMKAEVGDDVFAEDPTINRLEQMSATMLSKEAAVFVASGTMANQVAIKTHTQPGDEVILESNSHSYNYESGAIAAFSAVQVMPLQGERGVITAEQVEEAIRPVGNPHFAITRLIILENTHNRGGGKIFPIEEMQKIKAVALKHNLKMHLDGARIFNACVETGIDVSEYASLFDSLSFCLSKGLGAPVGSLIAGSSEFIQRARRYRKLVGGGMRQAGILAAAGIYALQHNIDRLKEDHENARLLAQTIRETPGLKLVYDEIETNMVYFTCENESVYAQQIIDSLKGKNIWANPVNKYIIRMVTNLDVQRSDILKVCEELHVVLHSIH
jgi:threonine aldolase